MASSSASGSKLAELEEDIKGLKEQKASELKKEKGTRDLEFLAELNKDLDRVNQSMEFTVRVGEPDVTQQTSVA